MLTANSQTPLVKLGEDGAPSAYPVYLADVRRENNTWSFPVEVDEETLNMLGYFIVDEAEKPEGDILEEVAPVFSEGRWRQVWIARNYTPVELAGILSERKFGIVNAVDMRLMEALEIGFEYNFGTEEEPDVGHVQLRDQDRANITGIGLKADRLIAKGLTSVAMPFRTYENVSKSCTPPQMYDLSDKAYDAFLIFIGMAWQLKDATNAALTLAELPEVPERLELPAGWETMLTPN